MTAAVRRKAPVASFAAESPPPFVEFYKSKERQRHGDQDKPGHGADRLRAEDLLAERQVHGGVAQGVGQALTEHVVYDPDGQLLTATFMDYAMPRAYDMPGISFTSEPVPSTANIMGMKGCGEAGTVGALAAVSNSVQDALWERGVRQADMPFTPLKVWEMLKDGALAAE